MGGGASELPWQPTVASTISDTGCDVQETGGGGGREEVLFEMERRRRLEGTNTQLHGCRG